MKKRLNIFFLFNTIMLLLALAVFNPFYKIWGYVHTELANSYEPYKITITQNTIFNILKSTYYPFNYKMLCACILGLEIILIMLLILTFVINIKVNKHILIFNLIEYIFLFILSIFFIVNFIFDLPYNIYSIIYFLLVLVGGISIIIKLNKYKGDKSYEKL